MASKPKSAVKPAPAATTPKPRRKTAASKQAAAPAAQPKAGKQAKPDKLKKVKMVRDSFTMPENDYALLAELKKRCLDASVHVKKSELLRAGLLSLSRLGPAALVKAVGQVEKIKTGRPANQ